MKNINILIVSLILLSMVAPVSAFYVRSTAGNINQSVNTSTNTTVGLTYTNVLSLSIPSDYTGNWSIYFQAKCTAAGQCLYRVEDGSELWSSGSAGSTTYSEITFTVTDKTIRSFDVINISGSTNGGNTMTVRNMALRFENYTVWYNSSYPYRINNTITDGVRPYQLILNLSNTSGVNNASTVFGSGLFNYSFTSNTTVQTNLLVVGDNYIPLPFYFLNNATTSGNNATIYINVTQNFSVVSLYYGAPNYTKNNTRSGEQTFPFYDDFLDTSLNTTRWGTAGAPTVSVADGIVSIQNYGVYTQAGLGNFTNISFHARIRLPDATASSEVAIHPRDNRQTIATKTSYYFSTFNGNPVSIGRFVTGAFTTLNTGTSAGSTNWFRMDGYLQNSHQEVWLNETKQTSSNDAVVLTGGIGLGQGGAGRTGLYDYLFVRNYTNISEPAWSTWQPTQALYHNTFTNNQSLNFTIPQGYPGITFYLNSTRLNESNATCSPSACAWWQVSGVGTIFDNQGLNYLTRTISENTTVIGTSVDAQAGTISITWTINISDVPELIYPLNGTAIITTFPPLSSEVNFTWYDTPNTLIQVASDSNFNILLLNTTTSNQYYVFSLVPGTYYWRAAHQNATTGAFGNYTNPESFTITASTASLPAGANIQGVVYETINGVIYPIEGAIITITNSSLYSSNETRTASNGYYLVTGLSNFTTYSIDVSKTGYDTPARFYFTTNNTTITHNVELQRCTSSFNCYFDAQFVRFHVQNMFGKVYSGVVISAYLGSATTTTISGTTDSTGSVDFLLVKENLYRITFLSASQGINTTWTLYPKEDYYTLVINGVDNFEECANKNISISATDLNATHQRLNLNYSDPSGTTTRINFTVYYANNRTVYATQGNVTASTWNTYIDVPMGNVSDGVEYIYGYNSSLDACSEIGSYKAIIFPPLGGKLIDIGLSDGWLQTISIILIVTIGALFGARNVSNGAISISLAGMFFTFVGWFKVANFSTWSTSGNAALSWSILISCLVISLILHMRKREVSNI